MEEQNGTCGGRSISHILGNSDVHPFDSVRDEAFGVSVAQNRGWGAREYVASTVMGVRERAVDFDWVSAQGANPVGRPAAPAGDLVPWVRGGVGPVPWHGPSSQPSVPSTPIPVQVPESTTLIFLGVGLISLSWGYRRLTVRS
jgi:hypothetical protein